MKHALLLSAGFLALAACGGAGSSSSLKADCLVIANDPEGVSEIAEMGTDADGFCDCVVQSVAAMPEETSSQVSSVMADVAARMEETGQGVEDIVGGMMEAEDTDAATRAGVMAIGQMFDTIGDGFDEAGTCPAA